MAIQIKSWVGSRSKKVKVPGNRPEDVKIVIKLLNQQILFRKKPGKLMLLDPNNHDSEKLINAIKWFQKEILQLRLPDGRVDPKGFTFDILKNSFGHSRIDVFVLACNALRKKPIGSITKNVWTNALRSLRENSSCTKLYKPNLITLIDFTLPSNKPRMWITDIAKQKLLLQSPFLVAHGKGGGDKAPSSKNRKNSIPKYFSNKKETNLSTVGAFVTLHTKGDTKLGQFKDGKSRPKMYLEGLEKTNSNARGRGIFFHAAKYVKPKEKDVGMSHGCFATEESVNAKILPIIKHGSFVYAYAPSIKKYPKFSRYE